MANRIKIKKGLDIPLLGKPEEVYRGQVKSEFIKVFPDDFHGVTPKLLVKLGDSVKAGNALFHSKNNPEILFASPVSGEIIEIARGEKRKILYVTIKADKEITYENFGVKNPNSLSSQEIKQSILNAGIWYFIKQRPYDVIARSEITPRDIFVTGFDSSPLAPSYDFILKDRESDLQTGLDALTKLTNGNVYLSISTSTQNSGLKNAKNVVVTEFEGPHPAGNVGVQINNLKPVNKGEIVWTLNALDVAIIGKLFNEGLVDLTRTVALSGSEVKQTGYYKMLVGTDLSPLFKNNVTEGINLRYISGNPLTGDLTSESGSLRAYNSQLTVIPEGDEVNEVFGWASLSPNRYSAGCTYPHRKKNYRLDARILGGPRTIVVSNEYDKVFPFDIFPEQLIKATLKFNIEKMEKLGIYEVAPEDFSLCEFVDTSKLELQKIIRAGLDMLRKEME
ncbi:MAG: Na(+)-translocating NADH-quinone reductase subunit A [Dysgonamonadaceae bacterium]|jgi:Na+-transporting NADH:ubiquinone oxidoreductase subunit A|nr:Na(+)-translocating NADH-quinone reductase subunit A [Dysgonamonadaceae bacterium]MDD3308877.1 Na(+)-translocating NADH-quinone reductase subunit A [Dysgonamonadaceae bacterium]MDD3900405.1 Na(+)-translocating NADH-quinone reductase subunit A [Dysgonamonadaceae bacterium]MDD4398233.1 Na(+)-translocating NADH-quinone reductase subunit A [Dysgonamonadaceae bacterium]MEA5080715.1 Na(+)-translocating NADH-quinone reductase subunit A [Dysgonamonadaceae bacterium]